MIENNEFNQLVKRKYDDIYCKYKPPSIYSYFNSEHIVNAYTEMKAIYDKLKELPENSDIPKELNDQINQVNNKYMFFNDSIISFIEKNKLWLLKTYFIQGKFLLNPLEFANPDELTTKLKELKFIQEILQEEYDRHIEFYKRCDSCDEKKFKFFLLETSRLKKEVNDIQRDIDAQKIKIANNEKIKNAWSIGSRIVYAGKMPISKDKKRFTILRHHDAADHMNMMNNDDLPFSTSRYEEHENVLVLVHNIDELKEKISFRKNIIPATNEENPILNDYLKTGINMFELSSQQLTKSVTTPTNYDNINIFITNFNRVYWLYSQTDPQPYPDLIQEGPFYKTEVFYPNPDNIAPAKVEYTLVSVNNKTRDSSVSEYTYNTYRKHYIEMSALVGFFPGKIGNRSGLSYDEKSYTFTSENYHPIDISTGIKLFPFGGYNVRRWLPSFNFKGKNQKLLFARGDHPINRLSLYLGMSIYQKQLHNFFLGPNYELVPGCGFSLGLNLYSTKYYSIKNNRIISEKEIFKPAFYLGITLDPSVLFSLINIYKPKFVVK